MPVESTMPGSDQESRRNPRRTKSKPVYTEANHDENDSVENEEENEEEEEDGVRSVTSDDDEELEVSEDEPAARRSGRSTRFSASLKEPGDSVRDLVGDETSPAKKPRHLKSEDTDEDVSSSNSRAKTPARSHPPNNHRRRRIQTESQMPELDADESEYENDDEDDDQSELKIQRIVASRTEKLRDWRKICSKINTSEIQYGSRWFQEETDEADGDKFEERFLVKWSDLSFLHCSWETESDLVDQIENAKTYLKMFFRKSVNGCIYSAFERCDGDYFDPSFVQIDRIVQVFDKDGNPVLKGNAKESNEMHGIVIDRNDPGYEDGTGRQFLIRWDNTPYSDMTYEFERDLIASEVEYEGPLDGYFARCQKPSKATLKKLLAEGEEELRRTYKIFGDNSTVGETEREKNVVRYQKTLAEKIFPNGGQLRDYQAEGVSWLIANYVNKRSSILADEMGLGKTLQTCAFADTVSKKLNRVGPILVVAPLSTLIHWQREFETWTDLNAVMYHGSAIDREFIREHEFAYPEDRPKGGVSANSLYLKKCMARNKSRSERIWMAQVVIATPEMMTTEDCSELMAVDWEMLVVDEAHRLKNHSSKLASKLRDDRFKFGHILLLTGTPIQNNMTELWTLLNVVDTTKFDDLEKFLEKYGDMQSKDTVDDLHESIRPYFLRRLKEDVEKSVPPKEETLIEVELTSVQKTYYRALYEKNVQFLTRNKKKALHGPSINNLAMQLRKCCNHPFLLNGVEHDLREQEEHSGAKASEADFLVKFSGKLVLLDKLLPRLREDGHRVLLFSQFKIMLDIIEDYLNARGFKNERIDGSITGKKRQQAIDRFQAPVEEGKEPPLVMMLSTRAGGVGINLTAADTCIIFDSDWNPQNDLQAQARCHRIGQTKSVKVYRLLTRKTYEMQMFHMSSLKMGLDQAVLNGFESGGGSDASMSKEDVERLLKHGAYEIFNEVKEGTAEAESNAFIQQDIDSILERRTKTVVHENTGSRGSAAGGTFSKASFKATKSPSKAGADGDTKEDIDVDDPDFWKKMVGEEHFKDKSDEYEGKKRNRKVQNYSEIAYSKQLDQQFLSSNDEATGSSDEDASDDESEYSDSPDPLVMIDEDYGIMDPSLGSMTQNASGTRPSLVAQPVPSAKKATKARKELSDWGKKSGTGWDKASADRLIKGLQCYGYGNIEWTKFRLLSKLTEYSADEIKHMAWSVLFLSFLELAEEAVVAERRRADRAAEKKRLDEASRGRDDGGVGGVLGRTSAANFDAHGALEDALKRAWTTNLPWGNVLIIDAIHFIRTNRARSKAAVDRALGQFGDRDRNQPMSQSQLFAQNIWPALRIRGWVAEEVENNGTVSRRYKHGGHTFKTTAQVMSVIPSIHPELKAMSLDVLESMNSIQKDKPTVLNFSDLTSERLNSHVVKLLLHHYAPLQLLADRFKAKKLHFLPKKLIQACLCISNAHKLVREAKGALLSEASVADIAERLEQFATKTPLPHPEWNIRHDAILIGAIVKHGWVEHDVVYRAIFDDREIRWGRPFEQSTKASSARIPKESDSDANANKAEQILLHEYEALSKAADRAAKFVSNEQGLLGSVREFRQDRLVKVYALELRTGDETQNRSCYTVNMESLRRNSGADSKEGESGDVGTVNVGDEGGSSSMTDEVPTKKDILKRARGILARLIHPKVSNGKVSDLAPQEPEIEHNYYVVDQNDQSNVLLIELLRALVKVSFSNSEKRKAMGRKLMAYALQEVIKRKEDLHAIAALSEDERYSKALEGMNTIFEHLDEVSNTVEKQPVQAKNILRAILGIPFVQPKNGRLFPAKAGGVDKPAFVNVNKKKETASLAEKDSLVTKPKKTKKSIETGSIGDRGLSLGMARAKDEMDGKGRISSEARRGYLELTALETLLLTVVCSQGLPVWTSEWVDLVLPSDRIQPEIQGYGFQNAISWHGMGHVFESAASVWYEAAKAKRDNCRTSFSEGCLKLPDGNAMKEKEKKKLDILEWELQSRKVALAVARNYNNDPLALAKKTIMLLEVIRSRMGMVETKRGTTSSKIRKQNRSEFGLGPVVLHWFSKEVERWADSLELTDVSGRPIAYSAIDYANSGNAATDAGDVLLKPAALMDKKGCRNVMIQVSQQTRSRSIWLKYGEKGINEKLEKAIKICSDCGDEWADQPVWWGKSEDVEGGRTVEHDLTMMDSLLQSGYSGIEDRMNTFVEDDSPKLTRSAVQYRANQLTRELHSLLETEEAMERIRSVVGGTLKTKDLATRFESSPEMAKVAPESGANFSLKAQSEKEPHDEDSDVEIIDIGDHPPSSPAKRKSEGFGNGKPPEKKLKSE